MKKLVIIIIAILTLAGCGKKDINTQKEQAFTEKVITETVIEENVIDENITYYEDVSNYW